MDSAHAPPPQLQPAAKSSEFSSTNPSAGVDSSLRPAMLPSGKQKPSDQTLEDVSDQIPGSLFLRHALSSCDSPLEFITTFQNQQGIRLQSVTAPLALLDLHSITRLTVHERCYERVLERLRQQIDLLTTKAYNKNAGGADNATVASDPKTAKQLQDDAVQAREKLEKFLHVAFRYANVPRIRSAVLHLLRSIPSLPAKYKTEIANNIELYQLCDLSVKRQIWLERRDLFEKEIDHYIRLYIDKRRYNMFDLSKRKGLFGTFSAERRADADFREFVDMIGKHEHLYRYTRSLVTRKFLHTMSGHYATLRADLIFAVHERQPQLEHRDALVYKMAWLLEEMSKKAHLDARTADELMELLRQLQENAANAASAAESEAVGGGGGGGKKGNKQARSKEKAVARQHGQNLHDAAFLLMQPNVLFSLGFLISRTTEACLHHEELPKKQRMLMVVLRLLNLACFSPIMLGSKDKRAREPELDDTLLSTFMPAMLAAFVDEQLERLHKTLNTTSKDNKKSDTATTSTPQQLTTKSGLTAVRTKSVELSVIFAAVHESPTAVYIFLNFIGVAVKSGCFRLASQCVRHLPEVFGNIVLENDYLIHYLIILLGFGMTSTAIIGPAAGSGSTNLATPTTPTTPDGGGSSFSAASIAAVKQRTSHAKSGSTWPDEFVDTLFQELLGKELENRLAEQKKFQLPNSAVEAESVTTAASSYAAERDRRRPMNVVRHILVCIYLTVDRIPFGRRESLLRMVEKYCMQLPSPAENASLDSKNVKKEKFVEAAGLEYVRQDEKAELAAMYGVVAKRVREKVGGASGVRTAAGGVARNGATTALGSGGSGMALFQEYQQFPINIPGFHRVAF